MLHSIMICHDFVWTWNKRLSQLRDENACFFIQFSFISQKKQTFAD